MKDFKGKVAVITGAGNGFGLDFAKECARREMRIVIADINVADLNKAENMLLEMGAEVLSVPTDVSQYTAMENLANKTLERFETVDLFFNNAGVVVPGPIWEIPTKDWDWIISVNVNGVAYGLRAFIPIMLKLNKPCHIVQTASVAGLLSTGTMPAYHTSKFASVGLAESVNQALREMNSKIKMSVFCPGFVQTDLHHCDRQRPIRFAIAPDEPYYQSPTFKAGLQRAEYVITTGKPIDEITPMVFKAIEDERFYILTHPQYNPMIEKRVQDVLEGATETV